MAHEKPSESASVAVRLADYRETIDNLDAAIVHLLAERFRVTGRIGMLKHEENIPAGDPDRESAQLRRLGEIARSSGLDPAVVDIVFPPIMAEVRRRHDLLRSGDTTD